MSKKIYILIYYLMSYLYKKCICIFFITTLFNYKNKCIICNRSQDYSHRCTYPRLTETLFIRHKYSSEHFRQENWPLSNIQQRTDTPINFIVTVRSHINAEYSINFLSLCLTIHACIPKSLINCKVVPLSSCIARLPYRDAK